MKINATITTSEFKSVHVTPTELLNAMFEAAKCGDVKLNDLTRLTIHAFERKLIQEAIRTLTNKIGGVTEGEYAIIERLKRMSQKDIDNLFIKRESIFTSEGAYDYHNNIFHDEIIIDRDILNANVQDWEDTVKYINTIQCWLNNVSSKITSNGESK